MSLDQRTKNVIICLAVVAVIVFIGAMLGTSLRKLSTEEGKFPLSSYRITLEDCFLQTGLRYGLKLGVQNLGNSLLNT